MKFSGRLVLFQSAVVLLVAVGVSLCAGSDFTTMWTDPLLWLLLFFCMAASSAALFYSVGAVQRGVGEKLRAAAEAAGPFVLSLPEYADLEQALSDVMTRNRERENHLQTEKSRLEVIIESITEGILVTGRDGRVVLANGALGNLFGLQIPVQGRPTAEVVRNAAIQDAISYSLEKTAGRTLEVEMAGSLVRHLDVHVAPIRRGNECVGVVTVFYDNTRLRQLERMRRDFVANVSHELRTPLTAIKGYAETLADGALEDREAAARFIAIISSHADRLNRLLDDLLDLSRLESDQVKVEKVACNLRGLVEVCKASVVGAAAQKNISVINEIAVDVEVSCDPKFIEQALINLLDNAIKYTPDGGEVRVSTRSDALRLWLDVADTGIGIPSADIGRIFERFYRVDKGRSRAMGGTGLGLAIVRHVVEAHGEKVQVHSKLAEGTTFSLSFTRI
jgi:two-component system, OmpR family, phosphate regulon sensor histidine kinase PhoR